MTLVVPKYRVLLDDTVSVKDPLAHGLIDLVEAQDGVTWDLIPFNESVTQLKFERGQRSVSARQVVLENDFLTGDTDIDIDSATRKRITDGHILYHPATMQRVVLNEVNTTTGVCTFQQVQQAPSGSRTQIDAGETLYILSQTEFYEEINAESRYEETSVVENYVQDVTERLNWSRADLREGRKWGVDKKKMLKERMKDIVKDMNQGILYNVPQAANGTLSAITAGIDYMIQNAGSTVDAAVSGTADLADIRGVLKTLQQNGVGPSDGLFLLMSVNVFHAYNDEGISEIALTDQPGREYVLGNILKGLNVPGIGFVPFYVDPSINDDKVRFLSSNHIGKAFYHGANGPLETPTIYDEPSLSTSKTPVSTLQQKWATIIDNASTAHFLLEETGLN